MPEKVEEDSINKEVPNEDNKQPELDTVDISIEKRSMPFFRYIPSRIIMQRLIIRATMLPSSFEQFEAHH